MLAIEAYIPVWNDVTPLSYMGRSVVDLPASAIHGFLGINESAHYFDRFVVVSAWVFTLYVVDCGRATLAFLAGLHACS